MNVQEIEGALGVIQRAIHDEIAGQRFYGDAAQRCIDPWAKEIFAILAEEEQKHTRLLLVEHESLTSEGKWIDPNAAMASGKEVDITRITFADLGPEEELFPSGWSAAEIVDRRASDLDALAFGIELEKKAIGLYGRAGSGAKDPAAVEAYRFLVAEESRHYDQLKAQWERLAGKPFTP